MADDGLAEFRRCYRLCGLKLFTDRPENRPFYWAAGSRSYLDDSGNCLHELGHWLTATKKERTWDNWGLGNDNSGDEDFKVPPLHPYDVCQQIESIACLANAILDAALCPNEMLDNAEQFDYFNLMNFPPMRWRRSYTLRNVVKFLKLIREETYIPFAKAVLMPPPGDAVKYNLDLVAKIYIPNWES